MELVERAPQLDERRTRDVLDQEDGSESERTLRAEIPRSEVRREAAELVGRLTRGGCVAAGEYDRDVGTEHARSRHRIAGFVEDAANHGVGGVDATFGEPQQGESRLGLAAELVRALVGDVGSVEVAA